MGSLWDPTSVLVGGAPSGDYSSPKNPSWKLEIMYFLDVTKKCQKLIISVDLAHLKPIIGRYLVAIWSLFLVLVAIWSLFCGFGTNSLTIKVSMIGHLTTHSQDRPKTGPFPREGKGYPRKPCCLKQQNIWRWEL